MQEKPELKPCFEKWCDKLDEVCRFYHPEIESYTNDTGRDCWKDYYEDGYSSEEAYAEDCSYGR